MEVKSFFFTVSNKYIEDRIKYISLIPISPVVYMNKTIKSITISMYDGVEPSIDYWVSVNINQKFILLLNMNVGSICLCDTISNVVIDANKENILVNEEVDYTPIILDKEKFFSMYNEDMFIINMHDTIFRLKNHINFLKMELSKSYDNSDEAERSKNIINQINKLNNVMKILCGE